MRLIYVDDAGSASDQDLQITAGIIVEDKKWCEVEAAIEKIAEEFAPARKRSGFEIHTSDLFQGHGYFEKWERKVRMEILAKVAEVIEQFALPIIYGGVHKPNLRAKYIYPADSGELAFLLLAERVERWFTRNAKDDVGMFIADNMKAKRQMRESVKMYRKVGIPLGIRDERLEHIVDTIHFADSKESFGVQLADFCAYVIKREQMGRKDITPVYDKVKPFIKDWKIFP